MIGAILGDWAAWTWEQDKEAFFRKLVWWHELAHIVFKITMLCLNCA